LKTGSVLFGATVAVVFGGVMLGTGAVLSRPGGDDFRFFDPLIEIKHILGKQYVSLPKDQDLQTGAINGMLEVLNDPYTVYVPPAEKTSFNKDLTGEYVGIGASVQVIDGWLTIISPLEDSPSFKVGLMADDKVVEIEGKTTFKMTVDDCIALLMGDPGTTVHLTIERKGVKIPFEIVRNRIKTKSVKGFHRDESDANKWLYVIDSARQIAYLRLAQFTPACSDELARALESIGASEGKVKGLVLDLRGNPGGLLNESIKIADLFLKSGTIVTTKGRAFKDEVATAKSEGTLPDFPIAVIVNGQSASASEVLSGALVENDRCIMVGTRSFGKGLVQSVHQLSSGQGELKVTEQKYYLPSGRSIQRADDSTEWGVDPTEGYFVSMTDEETLAMLKARREEEIMRPAGLHNDGEPKWSDSKWIVEHLKDKQLAAAIEALQAKVDTGEWKKTGEPGAGARTIVSGELQRLRQARERLARELIRIEKRESTLEEGGAEVKINPEDFWSDTLDLTGGKLQVFDKDGKVVSELRITGNNLERWLIDADVKKIDGLAEPGAVIPK